MFRIQHFLCIFLAVALAGCGSGSDKPDTGTLSVGITDAPVDDITELWISFVGITAKPQNGEQISWTFNDVPRDINLLALQDGLSDSLLSNETVPAGPYNWIRIDINPEIGSSYAILETNGQSIDVEVDVPSDRLRFVSGFTITQGQNYRLMIDWDIHRSMSIPVGQQIEDVQVAHLRPAWRVTDLAAFATISGSIATGLVEDDRGEESDQKNCAEATAPEGDKVYLYDLMDHETGVFDDIFVSETSEEGPIATAPVYWNADTSRYEYQIHYVDARDPDVAGDPQHNYTLAFTCQGKDDLPNSQDSITFLSFVDVVDLVDQQDVLDADFE
jgi:hypothetical protein